MSKIDQETVKIIFSESMLKYQQMVEQSTDTFKQDVELLERDTLASITKHLTRINEEYQEKKDFVNEFVILNFTELKSTVDANFDIIKQQLGSLVKNDAMLLDQTRDAITENFNDLSGKFEATVNKVLDSISKAHASFKKAKTEGIKLLLAQIKTSKELNEVFTMSNFTKIMETFATELIQKPRVINESIRGKTDGIRVPLMETLDRFEETSNANLNEFMQTHQKQSKKLKADLQKSLDKVLDAQEKLSLGARISFLKAIKDEAGEAVDKFKTVQKRLSKDFNEYIEEINGFTKKSLGTIDDFSNDLKKAKQKLDGILKSVPAENEDLNKNVKEAIALVENLGGKNKDYKKDLGKVHEKGLNKVARDSNECMEECKDSIESINKKMDAIEKTVEKKQNTISNEFKEKFSSIFSKENLENVLDNQTEFFRSFIQNFSGVMNNLKEMQESLINKAIEDLTVLNVESFSELEQSLRNEITAFIEYFKTLGGETSKSIKGIASSIASEEDSIQSQELKEYKDMLLDLSAYFEESMAKAQQSYERLFKNQYGTLFKSFDDMAGKFSNTVEHFKKEQEVALKESTASNANLVAKLKDVLDAQLKEFDERIQLDLESLMNANQDIVGRIMVKSAETGSEFNTEAEKTANKNKEIVYTFLSDIEHRMENFQFIFGKVLEQIQDRIMEKLAKDRNDGPIVVPD